LGILVGLGVFVGFGEDVGNGGCVGRCPMTVGRIDGRDEGSGDFVGKYAGAEVGTPGSSGGAVAHSNGVGSCAGRGLTFSSWGEIDIRLGSLKDCNEERMEDPEFDND